MDSSQKKLRNKHTKKTEEGSGKTTSRAAQVFSKKWKKFKALGYWPKNGLFSTAGGQSTELFTEDLTTDSSIKRKTRKTRIISEEVPVVCATPAQSMMGTIQPDPQPKKNQHYSPEPILKILDNQPTSAEDVKGVMRRFVTATSNKGVKGLLEEYDELKKAYKAEAVDKTACLQNIDKNRYKDIFCVEQTRVVLTPTMDYPNDYIHANWIKNLPELTKSVICTQAPLTNTIDDFWRMVVQERCGAIIMLCDIIELGKKKCEQYWPATQGEKMVCAGIEITNINIEMMTADCLHTQLQVIDTNKQQLNVSHVLWRGWPDKGVPASPTGALRLVMRIQTLQPMVVHCSAGVGRTGTLVALESCLRVLEAGYECSVYNVVKMLRTKRYLACQTDLQYAFLHRAILGYIVMKQVVDSSVILKFNRDYDAVIKDNKDKKEKKEHAMNSPAGGLSPLVVPTPPTSPTPTSPNPTSPNPTSPNPASPNPSSPNPVSPNPTSPNPTSPNPTSPNPTSPNPHSPNLQSPNPASPNPASPNPGSFERY